MSKKLKSARSTQAGRRRITVSLAVILVTSAHAQWAQVLDKAVDVNVSSQKVSTALIELSKEAGIQLLMPGRDLDKFETRGVHGHMSLRAALAGLLQDTKYGFHQAGENTVGIDAPDSAALPASVGGDEEPAFSGVKQLSEILVVAQAENSYVTTDSSGASRMNNSLLDTPQSVNVITRKLMDDQQAQTLADAVTNASGVQVSQNQFGSSFNVRGMGSATVMNNGVVNNGQYVTATPIWGVDSIEVIKGPDAILAGSTQGFGGAINIVNKQPQTTPYAAVNAGFGSYGQAQVGADLAGALSNNKELSYRFVAQGDRTGTNGAGYDSKNGYYLAPSLRWANDTTSLLGGAERTVNNTPSRPFTVAPNGVLSDSLSPVRVIGSPEDGLETTDTRVYYALTQKIFGSDWSFRSTGSYDRQHLGIAAWEPEFWIPPEQLGYVFMAGLKLDISTSTYANQADLAGKFSTGPFAHQLRVGVDFTRTDLTDDYGFDLAPTLFNVYSSPPLPSVRSLPASSLLSIGTTVAIREIGYVMQDQVTWADKWHALIGVRDGHYQSSGAEGADNTNAEIWLPNIGLVYNVTPNVSAYASSTRGYRVNFLDFTSTGSIVPPTKSTQYEAGVKFYTADKLLSLTTAVFQIRTSNTPEEINGTSFYYVGPAQTSKGFETDLNGHVLPGLDVGTSYAYTIPKNEDHSPVLNIANSVVSFWAGYRFQYAPLQHWSLGLRVLGRSGANDEIGSNPYPYQTFRNAGNTSVDTHLGYTANRWSVNFGVKDLFDRRIYSLYGTDLYQPLDAIGCTYEVTAKINF